MLSSPRKPPSNRFLPKRSLRFTHQLKFSSQLSKRPLEKLQIACAFECLLRPVQEDRGPGMHGRVYVAEVPLVGRNLTGRMQEKLLQHQVELFFREIHIDGGERDSVEGQIPGGKPRIFPLVRHRDDVLIHHVEPFAVPHLPAVRPHRIDAMFLEPFVHVETEVLLAPQHPGQRLAHDEGLIFADTSAE